MKEFFVSIGIEEITANYETTVKAENTEEAEELVREMWYSGEFYEAEITPEDYQDATLLGKEGVYIREVGDDGLEIN